MKKRYGAMILAFLLMIPFTGRSEQNAEISADDIIKNLQTVFALVEDYSVRLRVKVDMINVRVPDRDIKLYFKQPDKIHLEAEGFAMLPREGIIVNPNRFNEKDFYMSFLGEELLRGCRTYKLELVPRNDSIKIRKLNLWVDPEKWLVISVYTVTWQGQSAMVDIQYNIFDGKYWMPETAVAEVDLKGFTGFSSFHGSMGEENAMDDYSDKKPGKIFMEFYNYEINGGISDSMFYD
jgi:outer membrane lipoprotein-sorting protein